MLERQNERKMDLHWIVRERENLAWFTHLLNESHARSNTPVDIHTYVTGRSPTTLLAHVCRTLLERHRTLLDPASVFTGLECQTRYGRPNLEAVFQATAQRLPKDFRGRIGVFFCGAPYLGMEISDRCAMQRSTTGQK